MVRNLNKHVSKAIDLSAGSLLRSLVFLTISTYLHSKECKCEHIRSEIRHEPIIDFSHEVWQKILCILKEYVDNSVKEAFVR